MRSRPVFRSVAPVAAALLLTVACGSNESAPGPAREGVLAPLATDQAVRDPDEAALTALKLSTSLEYDPAQNQVQVFALVKDQSGGGFSNLNEHNFTVVLNPKTAPRSVAPEDTKLTTSVLGDKVIGLVIDSSGSMSAVIDSGESRITVAKQAAALFVDLMAPGDRTALVDFDDDARVVEPLTGDQDALKTEISRFTADGATNLGGALIEAVRAVGTRPGRRAVVFMTDGDDTVDQVTGGPSVWLNDPTSTRFQGLQLAKENNLAVYTVGLGTDLSETGLADLQTFASETGGQFFQAATVAALLTAFGQTIPDEVNAQPPQETLLLTFQNPVPKLPGREIEVPLRVSVAYENATGRHTSTFAGTYNLR